MSSPIQNISRRELVGSLGAGLVAAAVPTEATAQANSTAQPVADPTTKYPKPPYTSPFQPWPGLASKMTPPPDHGETTYKGSGRLLNRQSPHYRRRFRHGSRSRDRLRTRRRRRGHQLLPRPKNLTPSRWPNSSVRPDAKLSSSPATCARKLSARPSSPAQYRSLADSISSSRTPVASTRWSPSST